MKRFRSNIKGGARLALLALLLQIALSFGHFHALAAPANAPQSASTLRRVAGIEAGDLAAHSQAAPKQAPGKRHDGDQRAPDGCAVCAVMAMASTVLFSSPPILQLPEAIELLYRTTDAEFIHLKSAGNAF